MKPSGARLVALVVGGAIMTACSSTPSGPAASVSGSSRPTPSSGTAFDVAVPAEVANLPLLDQSGRIVTLASLKGKTVVLADFLTLCQEICPLTSANLRLVDDAVSRSGLTGSVQLLEVTVDPERDTPARLTAYQKLFGARPGWSFATGTTAQITALWKQFGVAYERTPEPAGDAPADWLTGRPLTYDVDHQDVVIVIGPDGHERWLVNGTPHVSTSEAVPPTLQGFLNDDGLANETAPADPSWTPADVEQAIAFVSGHPVS